MVKYTHITENGKTILVTAKQLTKWNSIRPKDSKRNKQRKARNISRALRKRSLTKQQKEFILATVTPTRRPIEKEKPTPERKEPEERKSEKEEKEKGLIVTALIGLAYDAKKEPIYAELIATFKFKNKSNYNPKSVLDAMEQKIFDVWQKWWENGYAVSQFFSASELLTEGTDGQNRYGIIEEKQTEVNESQVDHELYVSYKKGRGRGKLIDKGTNKNPLE